MSAYIKLATLEYPRYEGDIRLEHPEIAEDQTGETFVCPATYAAVEWVDAPQYDLAAQRVDQGAPEFVDGKWRMTWTVRQAMQEEIDALAEANKPPPHMDTTQPGTAPDVIE